MHAITVTEPFASLIASGVKSIETRSWPAPAWAIGQPIAIHAAKTLRREDYEAVVCDRGMIGALTRLGIRHHLAACHIALAFPDTRGKVLATATLVGCYPMRVLHAPGWAVGYVRGGEFVQPSDDDVAFGCWDNGRWAWLLADIRPLPEPIEARGQLGVWDWQPPAGLAPVSSAENRKTA